jgi:hypothetical protein
MKAIRVLAVAAALATIVLTPLPWGRGFKKPTWISSPPNAALIAHLIIAGDYIIRGLEIANERDDS